MTDKVHECGACGALFAVPPGKPLVLLGCPECRQTPIHPRGRWHFDKSAEGLPEAIDLSAR